MTEATCRRELELEIPAEDVQKAVERVAREFARVARVPGFRPGKAPVTLIRRRFADDIKSEVLQSLVPTQIDRAVSENKMVPITQPQIDKVDFAEAGPVKFRATFEVLPQFDLGQYKDLEVEIDDVKIEDAARPRRKLRPRRGPVHRRWRLRAAQAEGRSRGWRRNARSRQRALPCGRRRDDGRLQSKFAGRKHRRAQEF